MIRIYNSLSASSETILKNRNVVDVDVSPTIITSQKGKSATFVGWLMAFMLLLGFAGHAQVANYVFSEESGTYTPITGGTVIATATGLIGVESLDDIIYNLPAATIPFIFAYDGVGYTSLNVSSNGFITFGTTAPSGTTYSPISATTAYAGAISVWGGDGNALFNISGFTGEIRYETVGSEFIIQWSNFRSFSNAGTADWRMNYQIRLHSNGTIRMVYDMPLQSATTSTRQVGLRGPNNTFATNVKNRLITAGIHTWDTSVAGTANSSRCGASNTVFPTSGKTFIFTPSLPPACPATSGVTVTQLSATTASVSWTAAPSAVVEWGPTGCVAGTGASAGACGSVITGSSPQIITGLTLGTVYSVYVRQDCTGSSNGFSLNSSVSISNTVGESCVLADFITVAPDLATSVNTLLTTGATSDGPNGTCTFSSGSASKKDRWVKFVAPTSGNKIIITTTSGTITDTVMQVWSSCPASGVALGCNDNIDFVGGNLMSQLSFCQNEYTPGATYWVQLWPYSDLSGTYNIKIYEDTACPLPPGNNDECAAIQTLTIGVSGTCPGAAVSGTTVNATASAGILKTTCDPFGTYLDVFYKFNSGSSTSVNYQFTNGTGVNQFGIYTACGTGYLNVCSSASSSYTLTGLTPNTDYFIVVWANPGNEGTFTICLEEIPPVLCSGAVGGTAVGSITNCGSVTSPAITASGYSAGQVSTYQWEFSTTNFVGFPANGGEVLGQTNPAILTTGLISTTTSYRLRVTCNSGLATDYSSVVTITINTPPAFPTLLCYQTATLNTVTCSYDIAGTQPPMPPVLGGPFAFVSEGFENVPALTGSGWSIVNTSTPVGTLTWSQGVPLLPAQSGAGYAACNFSSVAGDNTISNWFIAPVATLNNGDVVKFWTRTAAAPAFADRLQVRLSTTGAGTNPSTPTDEGSYTTLLADINPTLTLSGYPTAWTEYTITISGLSGPTSSRVAFRYFVTNGGPLGANSDNIGIDNFSITRTFPALACNQTYVFNNTTCVWDISGTPPIMPSSTPNINVTIVGGCYDFSGEWVNSGLLNGYYDFQNVYNGLTYHISYDGVQWVLWVYTITNTGFFNASPSNGLYPPTTGWIPTGCSEDGTLTWGYASPPLACYQTTLFNQTTCVWDISGTQPTSPATANINAAITGGCIFLSGEWVNSGLLNGYYDFQYVLEGVLTYHISFDGVQWVLWRDSFFNAHFTNSSPSNGLYPPTTGWVAIACIGGTLTLENPIITPLPCNQSYVFNAVTCVWDLVTGPPCESIVNLTLFIEGYYDGGVMRSVKNNQDGVSPLDEVEDITVNLHRDSAPFEVLHTTTATLKTNGTAVATFASAPSDSFYLAVITSNAIETWTASPQIVGPTPLLYDFTSASTQAYEDNMINVGGGVFAFFSGDINQDYVIDGSDATDLDNDIFNSEFGVKITDLNGDGSVDGSDATYFENNQFNSVFAHYPQ